jgi:branched-chain amino acid transport system substrate-binding protein
VKRPKLAIAGTSALLLAAGLASCGGGGGGGDTIVGEDTVGSGTQLELMIGESVPLTGGLSSVGPGGEKAAGVALQQIGQAIATTGAPQTVKLVTADNATNAQVAVQAAKELAAKGASCIAGAWASTETIPTAQSVSIPQGILEISPASSADEISTLKDRGLLNRTVFPDRVQGIPLAQATAFTVQGAAGKTVNIGARNDGYGNAIADTFSKEWQKLGGSIGDRVDYQPGLPSYTDQAQQIVSGNPDAILIADRIDNFPALAKALVRTGKWDPARAWGSDGLVSSALLDDPGPEAVQGMHVVGPGTPTEAAPTQAFDKLYATAEPADVPLTTFSAQNFDAVVLCYLSAVAAGSTNGAKMAAKLQEVSGPPGRKYTVGQLAQAVDALSNGKDIDYVGASGDLNLDADGDPTVGAYDLYEFKNNQLTKVGSVPVGGPD